MPIDVLMDSQFSEALKNGKISSDVAQAPLSKSLTEKLNFIVNNPDNALVQAAKKSKIISTVKDKAGKSVVDTSKYIDMKAFDSLAQNLTAMEESFKAGNSPVKSFLNKAKGLKVASVMANIGISCVILGYLIPKAVYKYREIKTGTTKFHVAEDIKKDNKKGIQ